MTVLVDAEPLKEAVRDRYVEVFDRAILALTDDMRENGPRSDEHIPSPSAPDHMVDIVELTNVDNGETVLSRTIHSPADYSSYVDEGTEPHRIHGRPLLAFTASDGTRVVVHYVDHPGTARTGWWSDRTPNLGDYLQAAM